MNILRCVTHSLFFTLSPLITPAQALTANAWNTFEGKLGETEMQLSLYLYPDGSVKGNYIQKYTGTKILLEGKVKGRTVTLQEIIGKSTWGAFNGTIRDSTKEIGGSWTDSSKSQLLLFKVHSVYANPGNFDPRYAGLYGTAEEVEGFARRAVMSILGNDKTWLADHLRYPLKYTYGRQPVTISNRQQFLRNFSPLFAGSFKNRMRLAYTTNLFVKNGAVSLANGALWIANTKGSTKDNFEFEIISIKPA